MCPLCQHGVLPGVLLGVPPRNVEASWASVEERGRRRHASGKSAQDVISAAKTGGTASEDQWLHFGEIPDVNSGATKAQVFDLPAGNYAFACWQTGNLGAPDAKGKPHAARGMVYQFTVT